MKIRFPLFLIIFLLISLYSCKKEEKTVQRTFVDKNLPQQQIDSAFIVETFKSDTIRTIKAVHIDNYPDKKFMIADTVYVTEFNKNGKTLLYCDKAEIDQIKDVFKCKGNVKVTTSNGILKTSYLVWDKKTDKITATNGVTLVRDNNVLNGETLITNSKFEKVRITKVSAKGKLEEKDLKW